MEDENYAFKFWINNGLIKKIKCRGQETRVRTRNDGKAKAHITDVKKKVLEKKCQKKNFLKNIIFICDKLEIVYYFIKDEWSLKTLKKKTGVKAIKKLKIYYLFAEKFVSNFATINTNG